jgi:hypothetical protein
MECSHCGKKGHPARNCYKRLNAQPTTTLSQNTTIITEPANTTAFQQYVTRKADKQESESETDKHEDEDPPSITPAPAPTHQSIDDWGSYSATVEPTWGRTSTAQYEEGQHEWYEEASSTTNEPNNYSPERNPFRSGTCISCEENIPTSKMNGPIICRKFYKLYNSSPLRETTNTPDKEVLQDNNKEVTNSNKNIESPSTLLTTSLREEREDNEEKGGEHDDDEEKGEEHKDNEGKTQTDNTLRQNNTRLGVVFSPRTLFTWKSKQDKETRQGIIHLDGIVQQAHSLRILVHYNPFTSLPIIQHKAPIVFIHFRRRWSPRPHKWSVAVLQHQRTQLIMRYLPSRTADSLQNAYAQTHQFFRARGHQTQFQVLDNECPTQLRMYFYNNDIKWQLVTPFQKRANKAERAIQTFKRHLLSILVTTNPSFPFDYWPELLQQTEATLNMLRPWADAPTISAYVQRCVCGVNRTISWPILWPH